MARAVLLTESAARDLEEIFNYILRQDGPQRAEHVLGKIESALAGLADHPDRGAWPDELRALGIRDFREIFFKPYRIIYRAGAKTVHVYLIADGRRDMQSLLERRMLEE